MSKPTFDLDAAMAAELEDHLDKRPWTPMNLVEHVNRHRVFGFEIVCAEN